MRQPGIPANVFKRIVCERLASADPMLASAIVRVVRVVEAHGLPSIRYAGDPPRPIDVNEREVDRYLAEVRGDRRQGIPTVFRLSADASGGDADLFVDFEASSEGPSEQIWCGLPARFAERALDTIPGLLSGVRMAFGGYHAIVEDESLLLLYRGGRAFERARAAAPPELRQYVPEPPLPEGAAGSLPQLLVPQEFDRRRVPDAVWWMNVWDDVQMDTVGRQRIETAGFERIVAQPNGALLVATVEPTDVTNRSHIERLTRIVEHLQLRRLQEQYRT